VTGRAEAAVPEQPSRFAIRGVIEGFYGNPWTHGQRLDLIRFIGGQGLNAFVYGPKDDPLVRRRWREPFGTDALERIAQLVELGADVGVEIIFALSPGLSIRYSSDTDLAQLLAKAEQVASLGVTRFALLLDDLPPDLVHEEDRTEFADIAAAHAFLAGRFARGLGGGRAVMVCPLVYHGRGDEPYLARLAAGLDPSIDILWTGKAICSPVLELEDARRFAETTGRPPLFWDNYPVNDVAMGWELHIGPYRGRDRDLHTVARGVLANPMELAEASKIPLATIADYLTDPASYDPEESILRAIRLVAGDDTADGGTDARAFTTFAENVRSSCLSDDDAPTVTPALAAFAIASDVATETGDDRQLRTAATTLRDTAAGLLAAADHLLRGDVTNPSLVDDCRPWIEAFEVGARAMCRAAELALEGRLPADRERIAEALVPFLADLRSRRVRVFGDALDMFLADMTDTHTRPGRLLPLEGGGGDR
jgi:hyaluronoglucosaminidase